MASVPLPPPTSARPPRACVTGLIDAFQWRQWRDLGGAAGPAMPPGHGRGLAVIAWRCHTALEDGIGRYRQQFAQIAGAADRARRARDHRQSFR
jgi:hypothetical protein